MNQTDKMNETEVTNGQNRIEKNDWIDRIDRTNLTAAIEESEEQFKLFLKLTAVAYLMDLWVIQDNILDERNNKNNFRAQ